MITDSPPTTVLCQACARGIEHYSLGLVGAVHSCAGVFRHPPQCANPGLLIFPHIPPCPGTDCSLVQHADGTLHWGGCGLGETDGELGDDGAFDTRHLA
jgi:hypothetical protein